MISKLEKILNLEFKDHDLILQALTHTSYANEQQVVSYERLEFLGDAVVELCSSNYLFNNFHLPEGVMTSKRAEYVRKEALAHYARKIHLGDFIYLGEGLLSSGADNDSILSDVFEAVFAVIYLENGYDFTYNKFLEFVVPYLKEIEFIDYKGKFQELVQSERRSVHYKTISEEGPSNDKTFVVEVYVDDLLFGTGVGKSKKSAEQQAAKEALKKRASYD